MKKIVVLMLMLVLLLSLVSCVAAESIDADNDEATAEINVENTDNTEKTEHVSYNRGYVDMSLLLPDGWAYETGETGDGYGITFWHEGTPDKSITVQFTVKFYGICGTGVTIEEISIGEENYSANRYTEHDGSWFMIDILDSPYHIFNNADADWWAEYGAEAMEILETLKIGEGRIENQSHAIEVAMSVCTVGYDSVDTDFDPETGIWSVHFFNENTAGDDQTVFIDINGNVTDIVYGE